MSANFRDDFPAKVSATAPLVLTRNGADYTLSIPPENFLPAGVYVWQLKLAIAAGGTANFYAVENDLSQDLTNPVRIAWFQGIKTTSSDMLAAYVSSKIGATATAAAYALAPSMSY